MKTALLFILSFTLAWADIKVTSTGYVTTKADTAIINFTIQEKNGSIAHATERLDQRVAELSSRAQAVTAQCAAQVVREKIEEADRYTARVNCERDYVVTRDMLLYCANDLSQVKRLLALLFEGNGAASPTFLEPTVVYGLRDSSGAILDAYEQALIEAKSRAAGIASRSGLKIGQLNSVEHTILSTDYKGLYWGKGARLPYFESNLEDKVVVTGTWAFTFATQ